MYIRVQSPPYGNLIGFLFFDFKQVLKLLHLDND